MPQTPAEPASFDHLIHVVDDLSAAMEAYENIDSPGLQTIEALTMPGFRNGAWGVDDERYVELATIDDWDAVKDSIHAESLTALRPAIEGHPDPGLVTYAVNVPDVRVTAARLRELGHDVHLVDIHFEDKDAGFTEAFVPDAPAWFPFFITYDPPRAEIAAMRAAHRASLGEELAPERPDLVAVLARSRNPDEDADPLGSLLECPVNDTTVELPGAQVRFEKGDEAELHGFAVRGLPALDGPVKVAGATIVPVD